MVPCVAVAIAASRRKRTREADDIELVPCNRLDVQTSGLVVLAETKDAARRFQQLLLDGKVQKRYRALVPLVPGQSFQANQTLAQVARRSCNYQKREKLRSAARAGS